MFTAGIGENDARVRAGVCAGLDGFGIRIEPARNEGATGGARTVSAAGAPVAVLVVPTDEEREIARQAFDLVARSATALTES